MPATTIDKEFDFMFAIAQNGLHIQFVDKDNTIIISPDTVHATILLVVMPVNGSYKVVKLVFESKLLQISYDEKASTFILTYKNNSELTLSYVDPQSSILLTRDDLELFSLFPAQTVVSMLIRVLPIDMKTASAIKNVAFEIDNERYKS